MAAAFAVVIEEAADSDTRRPAEQVLSGWFRQRPGLGRRDRGRIADGVYHLLRHRRLFEALARHRGLDEPASPAALAAVARTAGPGTGPTDGTVFPTDPAVQGDTAFQRDPAFQRDRIFPSPAALIARVQAETGSLPAPVRFSLPDWLWSRFEAQYGAVRAAAIAEALLDTAPTDIRVNLIRSKVATVRAALDQAGLKATPIADLPQGLRMEGRAPLETLASFQAGAFERQDAGSQRIVAFAGARRGQTVIDFCAGAGGKTLALASAMRNHGRILAFDRSDARLERLRQRCSRAGVTMVTTYRIRDENDEGLERFHERGDLVLVDAPCSGTGTLRRDPGLKWQLRAADIDTHAERQRAILAAAAALVAPGGRLVYATCSLLAEENEAVMAAFDRDGGAGRLQWPGPAPFVEGGVAALESEAAAPAGDTAARTMAGRHEPGLSCNANPPDGTVVPIVGSSVYSTSEEAKWTPDRDKSDGFYAAWRAPLARACYNPRDDGVTDAPAGLQPPSNSQARSAS